MLKGKKAIKRTIKKIMTNITRTLLITGITIGVLWIICFIDDVLGMLATMI